MGRKDLLVQIFPSFFVDKKGKLFRLLAALNCGSISSGQIVGNILKSQQKAE
jgi:hypothetical protein